MNPLGPDTKPTMLQNGMIAGYPTSGNTGGPCFTGTLKFDASENTLFIAFFFSNRFGADSVVAVPFGIVDRQNLSGFHFVDRRRLGVQINRSGRSCSALGNPQEQTENELRKVIEGSSLLL